MKTAVQMGLKLISGDTFEDSEGSPWICHDQKGWIRVEGSSRATLARRKMRVLLRLRRRFPEIVARIAKRLDGAGWWATHSLSRGY